MNLTKFIAVMLLMGALTSCSQTDEWKINSIDCPCEKLEFLGNIKGEVRLFDTGNLNPETVSLFPNVILLTKNKDNTIISALIGGKHINNIVESQTGIICNFPPNFTKDMKIPAEGVNVYFEGEAYNWCEESGYSPDPYFGFTYLLLLTELKKNKS